MAPLVPKFDRHDPVGSLGRACWALIKAAWQSSFHS